ncbi:MAG TPA: histidinol dehydrogenase [Dehalococcoidia bacterium]|nr:histidinol dehydrogenase [Dehalococcoidia bacterium]
MKIIEGIKPARAALSRSASAQLYHSDLEPEVRQIIDEVRRRGDAALLDLTSRLDKVKLNSLEVSKKELKSAYGEVDKELVSALKLAAERIGSYHQKQKDVIWNLVSKKGFGQLIRPLESVGVYAPGGTASYPSTVLMAAIPARVAGVKEVILVSPPQAKGSIPPATLVAADIAQVDRVFAIGGAQAIAALAFGTESVPRVDKICGPGNIFVVLAKKLVYGIVGIDGLAGPSEVVIIADDSADASYCAADLLAQAEHDPLASAILITTSRRLADEVNREVEKQLKTLKRQAIAAKSLESRGLIAIVANIDEAIGLANLYAPEHLCLMVKKADACIERVANAGCIFIGSDSSVVLGDYVDGPSHVLPTEATARFSSPLNILDFVKFTSLVGVSKAELKKLARAAATIARAEGLEAHAKAAEKRLSD